MKRVSNTLTVKELRTKAKELNIVGRWDMNKQELIDAIEKAMDVVSTNENANVNPDVNGEVVNGTQEYINSIEVGTILAFNLLQGQTISGKFVGKLSSGKLIIETKKGSRYKIDKSSVVWVKTGSRWPRWVLNMLKSSEHLVKEA